MTQNNGYLIVASKKYTFYAWAINLCEGIKDYYPEAQICLVTEERFLDGRERIADHLILCDDHYRAKLWGMSQSPFDKTFYIDADVEVVGEGIETVFDELGDADMMFTGLPEEMWDIFMDTEFPGGTFKLCGACCLYDSSNPKVMQFMRDWYEYFVRQYDKTWWPPKEDGSFDTNLYPHHLAQWDQFTLWWLTEKEPKYSDMKVEIFKESIRWNYWSILDREKFPLTDDIVLYHVSCEGDRDSLA